MRKQNVLIIAAMVTMLFAIVSCSKWDDFKEQTASGETLYSGRIDSVKVFSGRLRVRLTGVLPADPKIVKVVITWNDKRDSVVFPVSKGGNIEIFSKTFPVDEGVKTFNIQTFDAAGNGSVVVQATGIVYGPKYESALVNRPVNAAELLASGHTAIAYDAFDSSSGAKGSFITYTNTSNNTVTYFSPVSRLTDTLRNFKAGTTFSYRTMYVPTATAIDTFYSASTTAGVKYDVTSTYFKNIGPGFTNSAGGNDRWQTPADWITTADVRNGGNDIGGLDNGGWLPSKALSIEAWWGMTPIPNGKIYQTFMLPAGKYSFVVTAGDVSTGGTKYVTAAVGTTLPDIGNVPTQALAYKNFDKFTDNTINFQLASPTTVSLGIQAGMTAEGNFMKAFKVRLYSLP